MEGRVDRLAETSKGRKVNEKPANRGCRPCLSHRTRERAMVISFMLRRANIYIV